MLVIVIGRGAGGTRLISHALSKSGVHMGPTNESGDMIPPERMYEAVRLAGKLVTQTGHLQWDFSKLLAEDPPEKFRSLVKEYLAPIQGTDPRGWKLPETLLAFPWITKMFPDAKYIYWTRHPSIALFKAHLTDKLQRFGAPGSPLYALHQDPQRDRLESWVYQASLVGVTPKPTHFLQVHYEDFVTNQSAELERISSFLGLDVKPVEIDTRKTELPGDVSNLVPREILARFGYDPRR